MRSVRGVKAFAMAAAATASLAAGSPATAGVQLWSSDVLSNAERENPAGPVQPVTIVGTRNGAFSGSVAIESDSAITGLQAAVGDLAGEGRSSISADRITVRYAIGWQGNWRRYRPSGLDVLLDQAPDEVPVNGERALAAVWVTIDVPEDATPGTYRGELRIQADGLRPQTVPVELSVSDWAVPDAQDWRTWVELIQSPDTLALEYDVELWSDEHWELIARSMRLIRDTGSRVVYIPLLSQTNQGNEQSMVRWIRSSDGSLTPDYSIMEKYLDVAEENLGDLKMVAFYAWDAYLVKSEERPTIDESAPAYSQQQQRLARERWDLRNRGLTVTVVDEATGEAKTDYLPHYDDPESMKLWRPVYTELRKRMRERGLEDKMMLGITTDVQPSRDEVGILNEMSGGLPWVAHLHPTRLRGKAPEGNRLLHNIADITYEAHVYNIRYQVNPDKGRLYGWNIPELRVFFGRHGIPNGPALRVRLLPEFNITGLQRGVGRIGADFWFVLEDRRGARVGAAYARYPENMWRNLNIDSWLLAPGPDGAVSTARLENLREGLQECEARIFLESVLLNDAQRRRIGDLADRAQEILDERQRALWRTMWSNEEQLEMMGTLGVHGNARNPHEAIWQALNAEGVNMPGFWDAEARQMRSDEERKGEDWFVDSGWQERNRQLFDIAGEVAQRLGGRRR